MPQVTMVRYVDDRVIIATHIRSRGVHAFDTKSGQSLWSYIRTGWSPWRTFPVAVVGNEVECWRGERLDLFKGTLLSRGPKRGGFVDSLETLMSPWRRDEEEADLRYEAVELIHSNSNDRPHGGLVDAYGLQPIDGLGLRGASAVGHVPWEICFDDLPYAWAWGMGMVCVRPPWLYMTVAGEMNIYGPEGDMKVRPSEWRLLCFDLRSGQLGQDLALGRWCHVDIADSTADFMLLSASHERESGTVLLYERCTTAGIRHNPT